jgi:hypothetical protein
MALYLNDTKGTRWGRKAGAININCLATAGFSPGDDSFSVYYNSKLGSSTIRIFNSMDVAPNCFNTTTLANIPNIYKGFNLDSLSGLLFPTDSVVYSTSKISLTAGGLLTDAETFARMYNYTQLFPTQITTFTSGYYGQANIGNALKNPDNFLQQAIIQHTTAYANYFQVDSFLQLVSTRMNFSPCYFTNGYTPASVTSFVKHQ